VERGVILALHPVKIILEDLLFLILVCLPSELNIAVEVVRTKFTFKIGSNYNLFLTSSFEFQNWVVGHRLLLFLLNPLFLFLLLLQTDLNIQRCRLLIPNFDERMFLVMFLVDDAFATKVIVLALTTFIPDSFDWLHITLITLGIVSYNTFFLLWLLFRHFFFQLDYLRLLWFFFCFWLLFLFFWLFLLLWSFLDFELCYRFNDVWIGVKHISLVLLLLHVDLRLLDAIFQIDRHILVRIKIDVVLFLVDIIERKAFEMREMIVDEWIKSLKCKWLFGIKHSDLFVYY